MVGTHISQTISPAQCEERIAQISSYAELFTHIQTNGKILKIIIFALISVRLIAPLSPETTKLLWRIYRQSNRLAIRQRAHCILLSAQGMNIGQLMQIFDVSRKTIHNWFVAWESQKLVGLCDRAGRGRKPTFTPEQQEQIKQWVNESPKQLKRVLQNIEEEWKIKVSKDTIKRVLKSFSLRWRRVRRVVGGKPDEQEYREKQQQLTELLEQEKQGKIDLRYLDESGFSLTPTVPYAWQEKGMGLSLPSQRSKRLNVVGLMNRYNDLSAYVFERSITSAVILACIDDFARQSNKPTVIVMDQASIHTSHMIQEKLEQWKNQQVEIFHLPPYSPQLNLIEILWRFMKYEWIELNAYESWDSLVSYVEKVLRDFGSNYVINFA
jgi:transposase